MNDPKTITLLDESDEEVQFEVLGVITVENIDYAILVPDCESEEESNAYIFRIDIDEEGEQILFEVESEDELEMVRDAWEVLYGDEFELTQ